MERRLRGKQSPSDILQFNQDPSKPNVGCKPRLEALIDATRKKIRETNRGMALLAKCLRLQEGINTKMLEDYQKLNERLKGLKIYEAETVHLNNML